MRAGDVDFALVLRYTQGAVALWAVKISVIFVLILIEFFIKMLPPWLT